MASRLQDALMACPIGTIRDFYMNARIVLYIVLLGLILRLTIFLLVFNFYGINPGFFWADSTQYTALAKNIFLGNGFSLQATLPYIPDMLRTPGYPLFAGAIYKLFGSFLPVVFVQVIMNSLIPLITMWLALRISSRPSVAYLAGLMTALEPHLILYTLSLSSEGLFVICFLSFLVFFIRLLERRRTADIFLAGLFLSIAAIIRPSFAYFLPVGVLILAWKPFREKRFLVGLWQIAFFFLIGSSLLAPWLYRNYRLTGQITLSTIGWVNVYTRLAGTVDAAAKKQPFVTSYVDLLTKLRDEGFLTQVHETELYDARFIPLMQERSWAILKRHPIEFLLLQPLSIHTIFTSDNMLTLLSRSLHVLPLPQRPPFSPTMLVLEKGPWQAIQEIRPFLKGTYLLAYGLRFMWYVIFLCAMWGTYKLYISGTPHQKRLIGLYWLLILFFTVTLLPVAASLEARYRVPFEPLYFSFSAAGLMSVWKRKSKKTQRCLLCHSQGTLVYQASPPKQDTSLSYRITENAVGAHFDIYRCEGCGSAFQPFPGGPEAVQRLYEQQPCDDVYLSEEEGRRKSFEKVLKRIESVVPPGSILDIGAGPGIFLSVAKQRGWRVSGLELSKESVIAARDRFSISLEQGDLSRLSSCADASFDVITAFDVAEHLEDPSRLFLEARRLLRPGGLFVWTTPNFDSWLRRLLGRRWYSILPYHLVYFTPQSVRHVAKMFHFHILYERYFTRYFSLRYFLFRLQSVVSIQPCSLFTKPIPIQLFDEFEIFFQKL